MKMVKLMVSILTAGLLMASAAAPAQTPPPAALKPSPSAPAAASASPGIDAGYKIGPDDTIEVDLLGQADFRTRARVKSDGTMSFPFIGTLNVRGETPVTLKRVVEGKLRAGGYYAQPIINVEIVSFASRYVIVLGDVGQGGLQPVDRAYRVSEIIARAGGIRDTGAEYVIVTRAGKEDLKLPFDKLARGSEADDPYVEAGDKIFVPKAETYYIYGQVAAPGVYPIKEQMTLRKVIARSGGLTASGSEKRVKLFHDGQQIKKVDLERIIQGGDVLVVGERFF